MHQPDWEIASRPLPLEYGAGGGFITQVDRKRIASPSRVESVEDGRVLQGYACLYNKPVVDGGVKSICVGAFDAWLSDRRNNVGFWLDHDESKCVGDTDNGLELHSDHVGLAFRFKFPETHLGRFAKQLAIEQEYTGMSVGFSYRNNNVIELEGTKVSLIKDAALQEISFVKLGAIQTAFGMLVDPDKSLQDACRTSLPSDGAYMRLMRALKRLDT
jgi:HK97 family phage prohead protease